MNNEPATCGVCGREAPPHHWLPCMLCGKPFHFDTMGDAADDCGIIGPNPASNGC